MTNIVPHPLLTRLGEIVAAKMGLHFPRERWHDLERGISSAAGELGFADVESCIQWLLSSLMTKEQLATLASHLTVGETYFFREIETYEILETHILPELIRSRSGGERYLRVWSAGCSSGEEAYSIAILLHTLLLDLSKWKVTILATDINPLFLQKASEGVYGEWSFRDAPAWARERFFESKGADCFEIIPSIKKMVRFSYLNLVEDSFPSLLNTTQAVDIILCRNVLMYFTPEQARKVIDGFYRCLVNGGWLIVSASEMSHDLFSRFTSVGFPKAIFYRKAEGKAPGRERPAHRETTPVQSKDLRASPRPTAGPAPEIDSGEALRLARTFANQGKLAEALLWCEKGISADTLNPSLHYLQATILQEMGRIEEAMASLRRTLYLDQGFVLAHFSLGSLARQQGWSAESAKHFDNARSLLEAYSPEAVLPESDGMTAGRLTDIVRSMSARADDEVTK